MWQSAICPSSDPSTPVVDPSQGTGWNPGEIPRPSLSPSFLSNEGPVRGFRVTLLYPSANLIQEGGQYFGTPILIQRGGGDMGWQQAPGCVYCFLLHTNYYCSLCVESLGAMNSHSTHSVKQKNRYRRLTSYTTKPSHSGVKERKKKESTTTQTTRRPINGPIPKSSLLDFDVGSRYGFSPRETNIVPLRTPPESK